MAPDPGESLSRRRFLQAGAGALAGATLAGRLPGEATLAPPARSELPRPSPAQLAWQRAELGVVFHYDLHVFDGRRYRQGRNRATPIADPQVFAPDRYEIDQWFEAVAGMGARFAILTATHETGFALWPSRANPYNIHQLRWRAGRADLVGEFVAACRRHGIAPGIYLGVRWNSHLGVLDFKVTGKSPLSQARYNAMVAGMVREICTGYGELFELWFDGGVATPAQGGPDVLPIFERHQPDGLFYHSDQRRDARWAGAENGRAADPCWHTVDQSILRAPRHPRFREMLRHGDPGGPQWCPAMADTPLRAGAGRHEWFWEPGDERAVLPLATLMDMYEKSVGRGATLIVGLTPDPHGRMPEPDTERCREWGNAIRTRYGEPLARSAGPSFDLAIEPARSISRVVAQEAIEHGQRIRSWKLEGRPPGAPWRELAAGQAIGQRRIIPLEPPLELEALRLRTPDPAAPPIPAAFFAC